MNVNEKGPVQEKTGQNNVQRQRLRNIEENYE